MISVLHNYLLSTTGSTILDVTASLPTERPEERLAFARADKLDIVWQDFFRHPSQWIDIRNTKTDPHSPDFKHKTTEDSLSIDWLNPCWVQDELRRRGLKPSSSVTKAKDGSISAELEISSARGDGQAQAQDGESLPQNTQSETLQSHHSTTNAAEQFEMPSANDDISNVQENNREDTRACIALVASLKACADQGNLCKGIALHTDIVRQGLLESNLIIGGAVVNMYAKCGALSKAQEVFDVLPTRSVVSWNVLIAGYTQNERAHKALICFERMQNEGVFPDAVTVVCVLNACGSVGDLNKGQELHAFIVKEGLLDINVVVGNALIDMYACCRLLGKAQAVFSELSFRNEVSWTTLITAFVQHGQSEEALHCYNTMKLQGFPLAMATCLCILKACAINGAVHKGQEIHAAVVKDGLLGNNMVLGTALVDMYAKCGALKEAQKIFDELPMQDVVSWGALLDGYSQHTDGEEAIHCYEEMQQGDFNPDGATFICILQASGSIGAAHKGQEIHAEIAGECWFDKDAAVANSIIDMYAKCGMLAEAQDVFNEFRVRDVITWNALLAGYAQLGDETVVSSLLNQMIGEGTEPDFVTFIIVLSACSHRGFLSEGQAQLESMIADYDITPTSEHLTCMVDLFGRAGQLEKSIEVIKVMPVCADMSTLVAVLGACKQLVGSMELGSWALEHTLHLDRKHSAAYVCVSNMYAAFGKQEDMEETEAFWGSSENVRNF